MQILYSKIFMILFLKFFFENFFYLRFIIFNKLLKIKNLKIVVKKEEGYTDEEI